MRNVQGKVHDPEKVRKWGRLETGENVCFFPRKCKDPGPPTLQDPVLRNRVK